ncbi:hypothetical protein [Streptomyces zaomyceticus]|uniref:hypothetical protein n=1 Tax=Streptomyces zaomyceticus TaxID=68286 RepID=UPI0037A31382
MITACDLMTPDATCGRSAESPVDAARETAALGVEAMPGHGPDEEPTGMPADRRVAVRTARAARAVAQGMPSP